MHLVAGLGNPGKRYAYTRHNLGFRVIDRLARSLSTNVKRKKFQSLWGEARIGDEPLLLLKPQTYMNLSGVVLHQWISYYRLPLERVLVVHDDLDLEPGRIKLAHGGGSAGHQGVESIIKALSSKDFPRLKIGIGRPLHGEHVEDFVLSPFYPQQAELMETMVHKAAMAVQCWALEGISKAMNIFNRT